MEENKHLTNRYDFVLIFDVKDGNPNGDPDAGNLPRIDPETGHGIVTDVCLKRKVRNFIQLTKSCVPPFDIYVKEKAVLGRSHFEAFKALGIPTGQESRKIIPQELIDVFSDITLPEGLSIVEGESESIELVVDATADKKAITQWLKDEDISKETCAFIKNVMKEAKPRKPTKEETEKGRVQMCRTFFDIRTFGAVLSLSSAPNCGQVRGPVQMTFGRSVDPIVSLEHSITRMAVATEAEAEKQSGDNRTMGRKFTVPYGLYVSHGFISAHLAKQIDFCEADLEAFWEALLNMFDHDRSAARGEMATRKLVVFKHANELGNAPAHSLFEKISICRKDESKPARNFEDYIVSLDKSNVPAGVEIIEKR